MENQICAESTQRINHDNSAPQDILVHEEIDNFLPSGTYKYKTVCIDVSGESEFKCTLRVNLCDNISVDKWLSEFFNLTKTNFIVKHSKVCTCESICFCHYLLSKHLLCQHSSLRKVGGSRKDKDCKASLTIRTKKQNRSTRCRDPYVKDGLPTEIKMNFIHSHTLNNTETWSWLKRSSETKDAFLKYFSDGMCPAAAVRYHKSLLPTEAVADRSRNPPPHWVYELHKSWKRFKTSRTNETQHNIATSSNNFLLRLHLETAHKEIKSTSEAPGAYAEQLAMKHMNVKCVDKLVDVKKEPWSPETTSKEVMSEAEVTQISDASQQHEQMITFQDNNMDTEIEIKEEPLSEDETLRESDVNSDRCDKSLNHISHVKNEGKTQPICEICGKKFTHKLNLRRHILIHEGKNPYKCDTCEQSFAYSKSLKTHQLLHQGSREYTCQICLHSFTHKKTLKKHKMIHERLHK